MLSHFEPGVKIYIFVAIRKFGPYLYKSVRPGGGGWGGHIQINMQDLGEVREGGSWHTMGFGHRAAKRGAAWQQCCQKEIDRTISCRRILFSYIIFVIFWTDND